MLRKKLNKKDEQMNIPFLLLVFGMAGFIIWKSNIPTKDEIITTNKGVALGLKIVDENGNLKEYLTSPVETQSVVSAEVPTGSIKLSPPSCEAPQSCSFLVLTTSLNNKDGTADITVNNIYGKVFCDPANPNYDISCIESNCKISGVCVTGKNVLGTASTTDPKTKRGNLDAKWLTAYPSGLQIVKGTPTSVIFESDSMSLDEVAYGLMQFKVDLTGTYKDQQGIDQPLTGKYGTLTLRVNPSLCNIDNTPLDTCSTVTVGKYCAVGASGVPTLIDKASQCGCPVGKTRAGEVCI